MEVTNPSVSEIREWAYSSKDWPHGEWDLFLSWTREVDLFIELAMDHKCINQIFFLHMLYYIVGATYNESTTSDRLERINSYSQKGVGINHGYIRTWRKNIDDLVNNRIAYDYNNWKGGVFAGYEFT